MAFRDPLFKGCTRPAMKLGVPLIPLVAIGCTGLIASSFFGLWVNLLCIPVIAVAGFMTRTDDQIFRLIWLWFYCRVLHLNRNARFWQSSTYAPLVSRR